MESHLRQLRRQILLHASALARLDVVGSESTFSSQAAGHLASVLALSSSDSPLLSDASLVPTGLSMVSSAHTVAANSTFHPNLISSIPSINVPASSMSNQGSSALPTPLASSATDFAKSRYIRTPLRQCIFMRKPMPYHSFAYDLPTSSTIPQADLIPRQSNAAAIWQQARDFLGLADPSNVIVLKQESQTHKSVRS
ncbi:unnamed protein product [Protopolystoma xenopodis]|uniref:Uncharacterized protein n=1 Tax=Protopolystoma xenopodis TaxID=117903 RepID=A0A3S5B3D9_9PLAT|nr:unnamed protein product [Protopolystoma xenopodis]